MAPQLATFRSMRTSVRPALALALALVAPGLALLPACSSDEERLVVYSGRTQDLIGPLLERFADETGISIDVRYGDSADLALQIDTEGERSPTDVFISQSPGAVGFLDAQGRLKPLPDDVLSLVAEGNHAGDGTWIGLSGRVRVLVYNTEVVDEADLPDSVLDLTAPDYEGEVAVAPSNGSFIDFVTAMREELGDDVAEQWLNDMADNDAQPYANNNAIVEAVGRGEIPMGLVNHYYNVRATSENPSVPSENWFFPAEGDIGSLLIVTAVSKIDTTDMDEEAERLVEFLLTEESQRYFAEETFEYPLIDGVDPVEGVPPIADLTVTRVDLDELGGGLQATQEMIADSGIAG
jgi:iron(III) transport system substrate-binding protein